MRPLQLMDLVLTFTYLLISIIGILVIRSASMDAETKMSFWDEPHIRQMVVVCGHHGVCTCNFLLWMGGFFIELPFLYKYRSFQMLASSCRISFLEFGD